MITVSKDNVETGQLERNESVFLTWIILITTNIYLVNYRSQSISTYIVSFTHFNNHARLSFNNSPTLQMSLKEVETYPNSIASKHLMRTSAPNPIFLLLSTTSLAKGVTHTHLHGLVFFQKGPCAWCPWHLRWKRVIDCGDDKVCGALQSVTFFKNEINSSIKSSHRGCLNDVWKTAGDEAIRGIWKSKENFAPFTAFSQILLLLSSYSWHLLFQLLSTLSFFPQKKAKPIQFLFNYKVSLTSFKT